MDPLSLDDLKHGIDDKTIHKQFTLCQQYPTLSLWQLKCSSWFLTLWLPLPFLFFLCALSLSFSFLSCRSRSHFNFVSFEIIGKLFFSLSLSLSYSLSLSAKRLLYIYFFSSLAKRIWELWLENDPSKGTWRKNSFVVVIDIVVCCCSCCFCCCWCCCWWKTKFATVNSFFYSVMKFLKNWIFSWYGRVIRFTGAGVIAFCINLTTSLADQRHTHTRCDIYPLWRKRCIHKKNAIKE